MVCSSEKDQRSIRHALAAGRCVYGGNGVMEQSFKYRIKGDWDSLSAGNAFFDFTRRLHFDFVSIHNTLESYSRAGKPFVAGNSFAATGT